VPLPAWLQRLLPNPAPRGNPMLTSAAASPHSALFGEADAAGIFYAPLFTDHSTGRSAERGIVKNWRLVPGRSMVAGQRIVDIETEIGLIPVRTRSNGHLAEILAPEGAEIVPGQPLWRYGIAKQAW